MDSFYPLIFCGFFKKKLYNCEGALHTYGPVSPYGAVWRTRTAGRGGRTWWRGCGRHSRTAPGGFGMSNRNPVSSNSNERILKHGEITTQWVRHWIQQHTGKEFCFTWYFFSFFVIKILVFKKENLDHLFSSKIKFGLIRKCWFTR